MAALTVDQLAAARGRPVFTSDGERIGDVEAIYYDKETGDPEWIGIGTGFIATKRVLVPVEGASLDDGGFHVGYTREQITGSPGVSSEDIDEDFEQELYAYYGVEPPVRAEPEPDVAEEPVAEGTPAVTRAEEELLVGKRPVEAGRIRLRKWVETEPVATDVELTRETAQVRREPIEQPVGDVEIGEQEIELTLQAEEVMVEKQTVAKERIVLEKGVETETHTVEDELRKERVEIEGPEGHLTEGAALADGGDDARAEVAEPRREVD